MTNVNVFDDATTLDLIEIVRQWRLGGFRSPFGVPVEYVASEETPIYVTNDSGGEIPAYACMQVTGTEEIGDQNYLVVDQPADIHGTAGPYLFNGPRAIATDVEGLAQSSIVLRGYLNSGTPTAGTRWSPVVNQWYVALDTAGPFVCCGADDVATGVLKLVNTASGGNRLFRFTLNASLASGTADADILLMDGTDTGVDATVRDPLGIFASLTTVGDAGLCIRQDGLYYVIQAPCPA